ncbi:MAG: hypothetical protein WDO24_24420 [Pseudomonadota bacterium]
MLSIRIQATGAAITKASATKISANGRSAARNADGPDAVLRTMSMSRNSEVQNDAGRISSSRNGSASSF